MAAATAPQQPQQTPRKQPLADWPTLKILTPPQGRFSPKTDEWCLTYCSQNVTGRIHGNEPWCRSVCIRRVFPHEIRNVVAFKSHRGLDADGKAKYPLPPEGQAMNLPKYLGGKPADESEGPSRKSLSKEDAKYWEEGWYIWTSKNQRAIREKPELMMLDLQKQQKLAAVLEQRKEVWQEYQEYLQRGSNDGTGEHSQTEGTQPNPWWGPIVPPRPLPDLSSQSLLLKLHPPLLFAAFRERTERLLSPTHEVLGILHESIASGEQRDFALRLWEKACSGDPFVLASRTCSQAYERWKERDEPPDESDKKGST